jgi:hypothetical protein
MNDNLIEPNLYHCRCGRTIDVGTDDLAGDEDVVQLRLAHACGPTQGGVNRDR